LALAQRFIANVGVAARDQLRARHYFLFFVIGGFLSFPGGNPRPPTKRGE
jgi:hypothetical protein